jgi:hypothetical protein
MPQLTRGVEALQRVLESLLEELRATKVVSQEAKVLPLLSVPQIRDIPMAFV